MAHSNNMRKNSLQNNLIKLSNSSNLQVNDISNNFWIQIHIVHPFEAYILPGLLIFTILDNVLVLLIFIFCKNVTKHLKSSIRVYYVATAIGDIIVCFPVHLTYFLGKIKFSISVAVLNEW